MRHGVDVADSLTRRYQAEVADDFASRRGRYLLTPYRTRFFDTVLCSSLEGSFGVGSDMCLRLDGRCRAQEVARSSFASSTC